MLEIRDLSINFYDTEPITKGLENVSFNIKKREIVGVVGESGSGKTLTAMSIMGLLEKHMKIESGQILFEKKDLLVIQKKELRKMRGKDISIIFQEPIASLNPVMTVGKQVEEALKIHTKLNKNERKAKVLEIFEKTKLPEPISIYNKYPHELSGGMCQRIMIAAAIVCEPKLLIADEPTTALDVTIQKKILELLKEINEKDDIAIMFISHDLRVIKYICDKVVVMFEGKVVEQGDVKQIFNKPKHEYTKKLIANSGIKIIKECYE